MLEEWNIYFKFTYTSIPQSDTARGKLINYYFKMFQRKRRYEFSHNAFIELLMVIVLVCLFVDLVYRVMKIVQGIVSRINTVIRKA